MSVVYRFVQRRRSSFAAACVVANLAVAVPALAQSGPEATAAASAATVVHDDDDAVLNLAEPDFVVVNLPSTLRLPRFRGNFRLTHRFAGNLRSGSFSEEASNLFGIDQGAIIGFEYRFGVAPHVEAAFYRSSFNKTIQLYGKYDAVQQRGSMPVSISPVVSVEGTDNFQESYAPAIGAAISRQIGTRLAAYVTPVWVHNTAASADRDTTYVGFGGRVRLGSSTYVAGEIAARARGYAPDKPGYGVSIEKRVGAHMFSLTFTNTFATTFAQLARGGGANSLFLGFNLGRKFF